MSNIGYAIFKKTETFVIDANGMFEQLKLPNTVFADDTLKLAVGEKRMYFQRIASNKLKSSIKDAILVTSVMHIQKDTNNTIIGSAIIFKAFQVNENKIIDGVQYLLSQLKRNFEDEYNLNDTDLGVMLPSVNGNFNIFKEEELQQVVSRVQTKKIDIVSLESGQATKTLHHFCIHDNLSHITHLALVSNNSSVTDLAQIGFKKINIQELIIPPNNQPQKIALATSHQKENKELQAMLTKVENELQNAVQAKKKYTLFGIVSFVGLLVFCVLYFIKKTENVLLVDMETIGGKLHPIAEYFYVDNENFNLNVRSFPNSNPDTTNIVTKISDGDEIFVIGFDKKTLWAKIYCNKLHDSGYVSYKFISKQLNRDRVIPENRTIKIKASYRTQLYTAPNKDILKDEYSSSIYLRNDEEVFVKNKHIKSGWYSIRVTRGNKVYNGYLKERYLNM